VSKPVYILGTGLSHDGSACLLKDGRIAFAIEKGLGVLLNTSLNRRGMPIVETPDDALLLFIYSGLDVLIIANHVVRKPADFEVRMLAFSRMMAQASAKKTFENALSR
jgi:predicted NodU family carbamoyl transferase